MFSNICITVFVISVIVVMLLVSCFISKDDSVIDVDIEPEETAFEDADDDEILTDIFNIPGHENLYYSLSTREVYCLSFEDDDREYFVSFIHNNHLCRYINGRVLEVINDKEVAIVHSASLPN